MNKLFLSLLLLLSPITIIGMQQTAAANNITGSKIIEAAAYCNLDKVARLLLRDGAHVNTRGYENTTALIAASSSGYDENKTNEVVSFLINAGADVNAQTTTGRSALFEAAVAQKPALVATLLRNNANPNIRTKSGDTPLGTIAISIRNNLQLRNSPNFSGFFSSLQEYEEEMSKLKQMSKLLLNAGANPNIEDEIQKYEDERRKTENEIATTGY